ncbi:conserved protein of unknown function [Rhodovastum atsumiense]|uniref:Uncharacterized protein n=1 Tax=Rhodovastum atsumiense TaxID=504468 RepID=A0A5M6IWS3_9PROT|nr:hypothetical protein [Rhodovastum atsumiense]KAA5612742.1 hypothetical protein F1189_08380 [Rhodovastum atsumiense]CAH2602699.1 conserved protein of unknown function [Rhodovastum atsumiense]
MFLEINILAGSGMVVYIINIVKDNRIAQHRLLDTLTCTFGVPLFLLRPEAIPQDRISDVREDCFDGLKDLAQAPCQPIPIAPLPDAMPQEPPEPPAQPWWAPLYQEHEEDILPCGRSSLNRSEFLRSITTIISDPLRLRDEIMAIAYRVEREEIQLTRIRTLWAEVKADTGDARIAGNWSRP